jgi:Protein of unknown function (DUF1553)/Protein of unknown function (DUF1549)/Planctomycete cytochrome C
VSGRAVATILRSASPRGIPRAAWPIALLLVFAPALRAGERPATVTFDRDIQPILARCLPCHGQGKARSGLRLDNREAAVAVLDSGNRAIVPGHAEQSEILRRVAATEPGKRMPPKGKPLSPAEIESVRRWIAAGAGWPAYWAYRPLAKPELPMKAPVGFEHWARTPVDQFILSKLAERHLKPAPEADRRTLLRRVYFDLIGLPPPPEATAAFLADSSPDAYERVVDRLLASPHYGERWARHWMDVVHFAETHGHDQDRPRDHAWPYRDYLIHAFNDDKPYARFVQEQVAGDVLFPESADAIVATGFLATGPWDESSLRDIREDSIDREIGRVLDRDDIVTTVMSTFVSTTVHCARCHDHKFDPIQQSEYYALQADFAGIDKANRAFDRDPQIRRHRTRLAAAKAGLVACRAAPMSFPAAYLIERRLAVDLSALPQPEVVYCGTNQFVRDGSFAPCATPRPIHMLKRGDIHTPGPVVAPGTLSCVTGLTQSFVVRSPEHEGNRRAALARWLTDPGNGLAWRSIANRVWQYHFGRGLVDTPNDFGRMGSMPTHPELLDWLAITLQKNGGSLKRLHRLLVTSAVYRQSCRHQPAFAGIDADNRSLWRMNRQRLDAEAIHDAVLQISGKLDRTMGGPSVKQFIQTPGVHVTPNLDYLNFDPDAPANNRRSIYRFLFRTLPDPLMEALDCPDGAQWTPVRSASVTPLQALALLNDKFLVRQTEHLASRIMATTQNAEQQIGLAYEWILGRPPTPTEARAVGAYAARHGLADACRVLLNSNEFVFVE